MTLAVLALYVGMALFVLWLNDPLQLGAGVWPGAGVTTAALLLLPGSRWGWVVLAIILGEGSVNWATGAPIAANAWWIAGNCLVPLAGAWLVRRFGDPSGALLPLRNVLVFIGCAVLVAPALGSTIGSVGTVVAAGRTFWDVWPSYVASDALGVLLVAPTLLAVRHGPLSRRHPVEALALGAALAAISVGVFWSWGGSWDTTLPYLVIPLLVLAGLRHGVRGAALAVCGVALVANWATAAGRGPFVAAAMSSGHALVKLQLFLLVVGVSVLILAALVDELGDRHVLARRLEHEARHDTLTGLPNRNFLTSWLEAAWQAPEAATSLAVLVCDLDDFKVINDGIGHHAGDQVLVEVARRLRDALPPTDLVARLSGDEFVVVLVDVETRALDDISERLHATVTMPITLDEGVAVTARMSIGVAFGEQRVVATTTLRDAHAALHVAKANGRGRTKRFDTHLRSQLRERLDLQHALPAALAGGDLFCLHQPELEIATGALFSLESLVRWRHDELGVLSPDRFVPIAERSGQADALFDYVLDETLRAQELWAKQSGSRPAAAVNLSAEQLHDPSLPARVATALTKSGTRADLLWLEVTESAIADADSLLTLAALHDLGVGLAIDDFGTGWSSMERLSQFPWDVLKIDRKFVAPLGESDQAAHVVAAMIAMAHALGIRTVAEGVETPAQLAALSTMSCDIVQGFLLGRPMDARSVLARTKGVARSLSAPPGR